MQVVVVLLFAVLAVASAAISAVSISKRYPVRRRIPVLPILPVPRPRLPNHGDRYAVGIGGGTFGGYLKTKDTINNRDWYYSEKKVDSVVIGNSKAGLYGKDLTRDG